MGPERDDEQVFEEKPLVKLKVSAKKVAKEYFNDPIHYLFYSTFAVVVFALFVGLHLQWQLYAILCLLGGIKIYHGTKREPPAK